MLQPLKTTTRTMQGQINIVVISLQHEYYNILLEHHIIKIITIWVIFRHFLKQAK